MRRVPIVRLHGLRRQRWSRSAAIAKRLGALLLHGERRWFTMQPDIFMKLRSKAEASGALEPSSAFVFFESQLEELVEDLDLGAKGLSYREGSQRPGDVVFIPPSTIFTSLTYALSMPMNDEFCIHPLPLTPVL